MIRLPIALKRLIPGYTARWRWRYGGFIAELCTLAPALAFGDERGLPWIEMRDPYVRLYGFWTEPENADVFDMLAPILPSALPKGHFRLAKDFLTRFVYPHMRPDLKPAGFGAEQLWGFHGQHKDSIADLPPADQPRLTRAFTPAPDDVIIDCGAFLGFGAIRLARELPDGCVYAVEASAACHDLLLRNLAVNSVHNVIATNRAIWDHDTTIELEMTFAQGNSLIREVVADATRTQEVRTITIDQIVEEHGLRKVDMLSLTLNGAEIEAIAGAQDTLRRWHPRIRLAGWYTRNGVKIWKLTKAALEECDYTVFVGPRGNVMALHRFQI